MVFKNAESIKKGNEKMNPTFQEYLEAVVQKIDTNSISYKDLLKIKNKNIDFICYPGSSIKSFIESRINKKDFIEKNSLEKVTLGSHHFYSFKLK